MNSLLLHVSGLMCRIRGDWNRALAIGLLRDFIENRATNMALRQVLDAACETERNIDIWWSIAAQERTVCLDILEELFSQVRAQCNVLESDLKAVAARAVVLPCYVAATQARLQGV